MRSACIISPFPPYGKKHDKKGGVSSYTKMLVELVADSGWACTVLCDMEGNGPDSYEENGYEVIRCYNKGAAFYVHILNRVKNRRFDVINIQHELFLYGGSFSAFAYLLLLLGMRKKARNVVTTLHGVISLEDVDSDFVQRNRSSMPPFVVRLVFKLLFYAICRLSDNIVVHESIFKKRLIEEFGAQPERVFVIPHIIEQKECIDKAMARADIGIPADAEVVLFMGYLAGYKGIGLLLDGVSNYVKKNKNCLLVVGAGIHPKFKTDKEYLEEYKGWKKRAYELMPDNVKWIGFIDEEDIASYYSASDVAVFPYLDSISSSGPMALSIAYRLPFLASSVLSHVAPKHPEFFFEKDPGAMARALEYFFNHRGEFERGVAELRRARLAENVCGSYASVFKNVLRSS